MCSKCKTNSLLLTQEILNLEQASELIKDLTDVIERHREHTDDLDFYVFDAVEDNSTQRYIFDTLRRKIDGQIEV